MIYERPLCEGCIVMSMVLCKGRPPNFAKCAICAKQSSVQIAAKAGVRPQCHVQLNPELNLLLHAYRE